MRYKLKEGWTKERMLNVLLTRNTNVVCRVNGSCVNANEFGNHCAIGCFIPDDHMAVRHSLIVGDLLYTFPTLNEFMPLEEDGLMSLQRLHDDWKPTETKSFVDGKVVITKSTLHEDFKAFVDKLLYE